MRWPWTRPRVHDGVDLHEIVGLFKAGGTWRDLSDWIDLDVETRRAFAMAGDMRETELAAKIGKVVLQGDVGLARLFASIDGGRALRSALTRREAEIRKAAGGAA